MLKLQFLRYTAVFITLSYNVLVKCIAAKINQIDNIKV